MNLTVKQTTQEAESALMESANEKLVLICTRLVNFFQIEKLICISSQVKHLQTRSVFSSEISGIQTDEQHSFCLMLVPALEEKSADLVLMQKSEEICKDIATVTFLIHHMEEINLALQKGSSFFMKIYNKGLLLHDRNEQPFALPGEGQPIKSRIIKREKYWDKFHQLSIQFIKGARYYAHEQALPLAVFMLHQALQHCYSGTLKVLTGYKSNSNSLGRLVRLIETALPNSPFVLTKNTGEEARLHQLLLKGFSDARYEDKFAVSADEIQKLLNRVSTIIDEAHTICQTHLAKLKDGKISYQK